MYRVGLKLERTPQNSKILQDFYDFKIYTVIILAKEYNVHKFSKK